MNNIQIKIDEKSAIDLYNTSGSTLLCEEFVKNIIWQSEIIDGIYVFYADSLRQE